MSHQIGAAAETTYGTAATPSRFFEFTTESLDREQTRITSEGIRSSVAKARRSATTKIVRVNGTGSFGLDVAPAGLGLLLEHALGNVSTSVDEAATRFTHTFTAADLTGKGLTVQKGVERSDGTVTPFTFVGSKLTGFDLSLSTGGFLTGSFALWSQKVQTSTPLAAASYPTGDGAIPFDFSQGAITLNGTAVASVSSFALSRDNGLRTDKQRIGSGAQGPEPIRGSSLPSTTGSLTVEFDDPATAYDLFAADAEVGVVLDLTGPVLGAGNYGLSISLPAIRLNGGAPTVDSIEVPDVQVPFEAWDNDADEPITITLTNADATP